MLQDGKYVMQYDTQGYSYSVEIIGNKYFTNIDNVKKEFEIKKINDCSFFIKSSEKLDESNLTELQKMMLKGERYIEIIKVEGNTYYFVCRIELHLQCGIGKFIRQVE